MRNRQALLQKAYPLGTVFVVKAWERLLEVASGQRGFVTPADAEAVDVNPVELRKMAHRGRLEHPTWGVYRFVAFPRAANDELLMAVLWTGGRGAISHESALALYELCEFVVWVPLKVAERIRRGRGVRPRKQVNPPQLSLKL